MKRKGKRNNRGRRIKRVLIISILCFAVIGVIYFKWFIPASFVHYPGFGIHIPVNYSIHGIDISRHQHNVSWKEVEEMNVEGIKVSFAFIKATEGIESVDKKFERNWKNIKKTSLHAGAYHFFIATKSGKAQAINFIKAVELESGDLPPVIDIEEAYNVNKRDLQQRVADWLIMVERAYKVKPVIYTGIVFYNNYLKGRFDDYPLWIAHYKEMDKPRIEREWIFWQHSEEGRVNGIKSAVDFNVFNGDSLEFQKLLIK